MGTMIRKCQTARYRLAQYTTVRPHPHKSVSSCASQFARFQQKCPGYVRVRVPTPAFKKFKAAAGRLEDGISDQLA
jgi:hypothetical protein